VIKLIDILKEVKIIPAGVSGKGISKDQLVDDITNYHYEDPGQFDEFYLTSKEEIRNHYNNFDIFKIIKIITRNKLYISRRLNDFYKKYGTIIVGGKNYTDFYLNILDQEQLPHIQEVKVIPVKMPKYKYRIGENVREMYGDEQVGKIVDIRNDWKAVRENPIDPEYIPMWIQLDDIIQEEPWYLLQWLESDKKLSKRSKIRQESYPLIWYAESELQPYTKTGKRIGEAKIVPTNTLKSKYATVIIDIKNKEVYIDTEDEEYFSPIEDDGSVTFSITEIDDIYEYEMPEVFQQMANIGGIIKAYTDEIDLTISLDKLKTLYPVKYINSVGEAKIVPTNLPGRVANIIYLNNENEEERYNDKYYNMDVLNKIFTLYPNIKKHIEKDKPKMLLGFEEDNLIKGGRLNLNKISGLKYDMGGEDLEEAYSPDKNIYEINLSEGEQEDIKRDKKLKKLGFGGLIVANLTKPHVFPKANGINITNTITNFPSQTSIVAQTIDNSLNSGGLLFIWDHFSAIENVLSVLSSYKILSFRPLDLEMFDEDNMKFDEFEGDDVQVLLKK